MSKPSLAVIDSIQAAIERTRAMLFGPVQVGIWLRFGVLVFVEQLARGGGDSYVNANLPGRPPANLGSNVEEVTDTALGILEAYAWLIIGGIVVMLLIALGLRYLSCRAEMMFVRACAVGSPSLSLDWGDTRAAGNSLFKFHLMLFAVFSATLMLAGGFAFMAVQARGDTAQALSWLAGAIVLFVLIGGAVTMADSLTRNFVSPIMMRDKAGWREAWGKMGPVLRANIFPLIGYYALKFCFYILLGIVTLVLGCGTLCIGLIPIIKQTLLAPFHVFERNWSMFMLEYLGAGYEVFDTYESEVAFPPAPSLEDSL